MTAALTSRITIGVPLLAATLALCGCASISEHTQAYLGSPHFPPVNPRVVHVLAAEPNQPKVRLGEIILSIDGNPSPRHLEARLKAAAANLGADGVFIVVDRTHIIPVAYWDCCSPAGFTEDWHRLVVGVAFKYKTNELKPS